MTGENVDLLRRAYAAAGGGDRSGFAGLYDPDVVLHVADVFVEAGSYLGAEAADECFCEFFADFTEPAEFVECGDSVVVVTREGEPVVYSFRDGRIIRFDLPADLAAALDLVGLRGSRAGREA